MRHEPRAGGGDQHQGAATPRVIAARTPEDARPEATGVPHRNGLTVVFEHDNDVAGAADALLALLRPFPQHERHERDAPAPA